MNLHQIPIFHAIIVISPHTHLNHSHTLLFLMPASTHKPRHAHHLFSHQNKVSGCYLSFIFNIHGQVFTKPYSSLCLNPQPIFQTRGDHFLKVDRHRHPFADSIGQRCAVSVGIFGGGVSDILIYCNQIRFKS